MLMAACARSTLDKTHARLSQHFTWPGIWKQVKEHCRSCEGCQRAAPNINHKAHLQPLPCISSPFSMVAMDIVGPLPRTARGHKYILTAMCLFSEYPEAIPLKKVDTLAVTEAILESVARHSLPDTLLSDQGSVFMDSVTKSLCKSLGVEQVRNSPYHPQSDGALERWHACLKGVKRAQIDKTD